MQKQLAFLFLVYPLLTFSQQTASIKILADKNTSIVTYSMKHPMHAWTGVCKDVSSVLVINRANRAIEQVAVSLKVEAFDSGNANRDSHALEMMESLKYPKITFISSKIKVAANIITAEGNLNFHGITKPITIITEREDFVNKLVIDGRFDVSLTDFNIDRPTLIGMKTEDTIHLRFKIIFSYSEPK